MIKNILIVVFVLAAFFIIWLFKKIWFEKIPEEVRVLDSIRNMLNEIKIDFGSESEIEYDSGEEGDQYFCLADPKKKFLIIVYPEGLTGFGKEKWLGYWIKSDDAKIVKKIEKHLQKLAQEYTAELIMM